jgi:hypothetical protein
MLCGCTHTTSTDATECSETSVYKIQTTGIYPEKSIEDNIKIDFQEICWKVVD